MSAFWETRYAESKRIWSGHVNRVLADVAIGLSPGSALDLGCGEGADAIWLALHGWRVTGIDISTTAIERARGAAIAAGVATESIRFQVGDVVEPLTEDFDLITASFLHSPVALPRDRVLREAAEHIVPGGHLLITSHAAPPPWAEEGHATHHRFLSPEDELASLELPADAWTPVIAETRPRPVSGPAGEAAELLDTVVLMRRR